MRPGKVEKAEEKMAIENLGCLNKNIYPHVVLGNGGLMSKIKKKASIKLIE